MKILLWITGGLVSIMIGFVVLQMVASERVEVVEVYTLDETGDELTTRLWIVDYQGYAYLRSGDDQSGWFTRLNRNKKVRITRNDEVNSFQTTLHPELRDDINQQMQEKYTWGDSVIGYLFGRDDAIPIRLNKIEGQS